MFVGGPPFSATPCQGLDRFLGGARSCATLHSGLHSFRAFGATTPRAATERRGYSDLICVGRSVPEPPKGALELEPEWSAAELRVWTNEEMLSP